MSARVGHHLQVTRNLANSSSGYRRTTAWTLSARPQQHPWRLNPACQGGGKNRVGDRGGNGAPTAPVAPPPPPPPPPPLAGRLPSTLCAPAALLRRMAPCGVPASVGLPRVWPAPLTDSRCAASWGRSTYVCNGAAMNGMGARQQISAGFNGAGGIIPPQADPPGVDWLGARWWPRARAPSAACPELRHRTTSPSPWQDNSSPPPPPPHLAQAVAVDLGELLQKAVESPIRHLSRQGGGGRAAARARCVHVWAMA